MEKIVLFFSVFLILHSSTKAQPATYVDKEGVVRWSDSGEKLCVFGTNYSVPFAYWNARKPIGADYHQSIDEDVYHMARLGIDGYRIHMWESYISDNLGNLIYNEHFELFDYLLFKLKERGIKIFLTSMSHFLDNPAGFTAKYGGKKGCVNNPNAFAAQENFLSQFVNHVNPYTGVAYKDDKDLIGFEIVNEPQHFKRPELATTYINRMYDAMRKAGCKNPIFYNMTTSYSVIDKVLDSKIQGGTFQWYPSGLTANHNQKGNLLPAVDHYNIPFANDKRMQKRPRFVYEFSPSDIGSSSHIYPAMARSFREAGFQFAAHFSYDPLHEAYCNVEYRTHFLNLAYTPQKSIGMLIASEVFHQVPLHKNFGSYPNNTHFDSFQLDSGKDLAEMVTPTTFLYTRSTETKISNSQKLERIAGTGTSSVVFYTGTGAYFLDRLESGVWRLEVLPDAVWVRDPFFVTSIKREVAVVQWNLQQMKLQLPDLGHSFSITGLNNGNAVVMKSHDGIFSISPGSYLLTREGKITTWGPKSHWKNIRLDEFHAPKRVQEQRYLIHTSNRESAVGLPIELNAKVVFPFKFDKVDLVVVKPGGGTIYPCEKIGAFDYRVVLPEVNTQKESILLYYFSVKSGNNYYTYPGDSKGEFVLDQRIYGDDESISTQRPYSIRIVDKGRPVCLFDADKDALAITKMYRKDKLNLIPSSIPGKSELQIQATSLTKKEHTYALRYYCRNRISERVRGLHSKNRLVLRGHALNNKTCKVQISLLMPDGGAYGGTLVVTPTIDDYSIDLSALVPVKSILLPRAYPSFQNFWFEPEQRQVFSISSIESIQIAIGPGLSDEELNEKQGIAIEWIELK